MEDFEFHGYHFPKGLAVIMGYWELYKDANVWGDPENFRPERFLSEDGQSLKRHEAYFIFSVGKRSCPGEQFGKDQLFIFTATLFQHFRVAFPPNTPKPSLAGSLGMFSTYPKPHQLIFQQNSV